MRFLEWSKPVLQVLFFPYGFISLHFWWLIATEIQMCMSFIWFQCQRKNMKWAEEQRNGETNKIKRKKKKKAVTNLVIWIIVPVVYLFSLVSSCCCCQCCCRLFNYHWMRTELVSIFLSPPNENRNGQVFFSFFQLTIHVNFDQVELNLNCNTSFFPSTKNTKNFTRTNRIFCQWILLQRYSLIQQIQLFDMHNTNILK